MRARPRNANALAAPNLTSWINVHFRREADYELLRRDRLLSDPKTDLCVAEPRRLRSADNGHRGSRARQGRRRSHPAAPWMSARTLAGATIVAGNSGPRRKGIPTAVVFCFVWRAVIEGTRGGLRLVASPYRLSHCAMIGEAKGVW